MQSFDVFVLDQYLVVCVFFFFNDTATTEIYTLSLHDALPIYEIVERGRRIELRLELAAESRRALHVDLDLDREVRGGVPLHHPPGDRLLRSEEHTSELQSQSNLVCRLLLEKKNNAIVRRVRARSVPCSLRFFFF